MPFSLFLYCRAGFENECAAEIQHHATELAIYGFCKAKLDAGYVVFVPQQEADAAQLMHRLSFTQLIFVRQWFVVLALVNELPLNDRISPMTEAFRALPAVACEVFIETPDTNEAKQLSALCRSIAAPLSKHLERQQLVDKKSTKSDLRCHVCFMSTHAAYLGYSSISNSSPWPMGIPRLKFPRQAPSRSTLKLEEAIFTFFNNEQRQQKFRPGMTAVDLGACPGGWTWQLVQRGIKVTAVDNGSMAEAVMATGLVEHLRADGYHYRPPIPVDWMVCDIVETPMRTADLIASWLVQKWCRETIFNLKLPMKKRWQDLNRCIDHIKQRLDAADIHYVCLAKQLYHDREEVTLYFAVR